MALTYELIKQTDWIEALVFSLKTNCQYWLPFPPRATNFSTLISAHVAKQKPNHSPPSLCTFTHFNLKWSQVFLRTKEYKHHVRCSGEGLRYEVLPKLKWHFLYFYCEMCKAATNWSRLPTKRLWLTSSLDSSPLRPNLFFQ